MTQEFIGRIPGLSNKEYHASPGISKSGLDQIAKSPAHYRDYLTAPREDTKALRIGSVCHSLVLEKGKFDAEFAVAPDADGRTTEGKKIKAAFAVSSAGKTILSADELETAVHMQDAILNHPLASTLLGFGGEAETSFYWQHEIGVLCRCRPDFLTNDGYIVDIKTTEDASPEAFERSAEKYRYYVQAAFYRQGVQAVLGQLVKGFLFIAVEKTPPYLVACYDTTREMMFDGDMEVTRCLNLYKQCLETDTWPGYPEELIPLSRPRWAA